jgi:hypothetical protein
MTPEDSSETYAQINELLESMRFQTEVAKRLLEKLHTLHMATKGETVCQPSN